MLVRLEVYLQQQRDAGYAHGHKQLRHRPAPDHDQEPDERQLAHHVDAFPVEIPRPGQQQQRLSDESMSMSIKHKHCRARLT